MAAPKGHKRYGGRTKGTRNKSTVEAKAAIEGAFAHLQTTKKGAGKRFNEWAEANTDDFYKLLFPKLLPVQVNHADNQGGKLVITWGSPSAE
jgi:hypothetical protein